MADRQWHGVVIGVDRYPGFPSKQLSGCVNDANAIRKFLIDRVQVPEANIRCLTSPQDQAGLPAAALARAANIRSAFAELLARVSAGDHAVLFYAGHGLKLNRSAAAGTISYYGFAPEDVARDVSGYVNVILGSEMHALLSSLESKGVTATVIADTCHSGASTRGVTDDPRERVLRVEPLSADQWRDFTAHHPALQQSTERGAGRAFGPFGTYPGGDFVMLTGCLDLETSKEDTAEVIGEDGTTKQVPHGLLTLWLLRELETVAPDAVRSLRWMDFYERLRRTVANRVAEIKTTSQTVSLEGRREKTVFGGAWRPFAPGFTVRKTADGALLIDGGELQGLSPGAVIAIYPPETSDFDESELAGIKATIETATSMTSTAHVEDATAVIADLSRARLVQPGPDSKPISVRVVAGATPMPAVMRDAIVHRSSEAHAFSIVDGTADPAHAELRRWQGEVPVDVWPAPNDAWAGARDGWILVRTDRSGAASTDTIESPAPDDIVAYLPDAGPRIERVPPGKKDEVLGEALAQGLTAYGRYLQKRDHQASDDTLAPVLNVTLRAAVCVDPDHPPQMEDLTPIEPKDGVYQLTDAHAMCVEIRVMRRTRLRLQAGLVMFSDDGNIDALWPPEGSQPSLPEGNVFLVGLDRERPLYLTKRVDQRSSLYTLAVLAATGSADAPPLNLGALKQKSVQEEIAGSIDRVRGGMATEQQRPAWYRWDLRVAIGAARR